MLEISYLKNRYPKLLKTKPVLFPIVPLTQLVIDYLFEGGYKGYIVPWYKSILYHSITNKLNKNYWVMKQVKITDPGQQPTKLSQIRRTLNFTLSFFQSLCPKVKKILDRKSEKKVRLKNRLFLYDPKIIIIMIQ